MLVHAQPPTLHQCPYQLWLQWLLLQVILQISGQQFALHSALLCVQGESLILFVQLSLVVRAGVTTSKLLVCLS